jgi:hypothetical protein
MVDFGDASSTSFRGIILSCTSLAVFDTLILLLALREDTLVESFNGALVFDNENSENVAHTSVIHNEKRREAHERGRQGTTHSLSDM